MDPEPSQENHSRMKALQQKRTLAFLNHYVMTNVRCINNFMQVCEDKLMKFEQKLDRVDAAMVLLESKILSVPEVSAFMAEAKDTSAVLEPIHEDHANSQTIAPIIDDNVPTHDRDDNPEKPQPEYDNVPTHDREDNPEKPQPEYDRFVRMVRVGVPLQAAKLKCALEGLDPNVLAGILSKDPY